METDSKTIKKIVDFLHSIHINVVEEELTEDTFLPGIKIQGDSIVFDRKKLKYPGDLLHEAGHLATTEESLRPKIGTPEMSEDWPTNGDEMATILWSYSASVHLGLDLTVVFHSHGYKNDSEWLIEQFSSKNYLGLPLLEWMGLCTQEEFPKMIKWLR